MQKKIEKKENLTFYETIEELAKRANMPMPVSEEDGKPQFSKDTKSKIYEANKEDNYLNIITKGTKKSKERLMILDKIAKFEREERFDEDVEEDPPSKELLPDDVDYLLQQGYTTDDIEELLYCG